MRKQYISVRVDEDTRAKVRAIADSQASTVSQIMNQVINQWLETQVKTS